MKSELIAGGNEILFTGIPSNLINKLENCINKNKDLIIDIRISKDKGLELNFYEKGFEVDLKKINKIKKKFRRLF